jgi:hypothetical protein
MVRQFEAQALGIAPDKRALADSYVRRLSNEIASKPCRNRIPSTKITPVMRIQSTKAPLMALGLALMAACNRSEEPPPAGPGGGAAPSAVAGRAPYREVTPGAWGRITGTIDVEGGRTADTTVIATHDQETCGDTLLLRTLDYDAGVVGSIVWLEEVRSGKALPVERRYELVNERCRLTPETQAVMMGGTLNVRSLDPAEHRLRLVIAPHRKPNAVISLYTPGQTIPVQNLLRIPGRIGITCDRHPWTHGWVLVFDHPYFTQTREGGAFALDSVPPGKYRLVAWHSRYGSVEQPITVGPNAEAKATLKFEVVSKAETKATDN